MLKTKMLKATHHFDQEATRDGIFQGVTAQKLDQNSDFLARLLNQPKAFIQHVQNFCGWIITSR